MVLFENNYFTVLFLIVCIFINISYTGEVSDQKDDKIESNDDISAQENPDTMTEYSDENQQKYEAFKEKRERMKAIKNKCEADIKDVYKDCSQCQENDVLLGDFATYTFPNISLADIEKNEGSTDVNPDIAIETMNGGSTDVNPDVAIETMNEESTDVNQDEEIIDSSDEEERRISQLNFPAEFIKYLKEAICEKRGMTVFICFPWEFTFTQTPKKFCGKLSNKQDKNDCTNAMRAVGLIDVLILTNDNEKTEPLLDDNEKTEPLLGDTEKKIIKLDYKEMDLTDILQKIFTDLTIEKVKKDLPENKSVHVVNYIEHVAQNFDFNPVYLKKGRTVDSFCDELVNGPGPDIGRLFGIL